MNNVFFLIPNGRQKDDAPREHASSLQAHHSLDISEAVKRNFNAHVTQRLLN